MARGPHGIEDTVLCSSAPAVEGDGAVWALRSAALAVLSGLLPDIPDPRAVLADGALDDPERYLVVVSHDGGSRADLCYAESTALAGNVVRERCLDGDGELTGIYDLEARGSIPSEVGASVSVGLTGADVSDVESEVLVRRLRGLARRESVLRGEMRIAGPSLRRDARRFALVSLDTYGTPELVFASGTHDTALRLRSILHTERRLLYGFDLGQRSTPAVEIRIEVGAS